MRIFDCDADKSIKTIILYLKIEEAIELYDSLNTLTKRNELTDHTHINDSTFEHEITISLYDEQKIDMLNDKSKEIILNE